MFPIAGDANGLHESCNWTTEDFSAQNKNKYKPTTEAKKQIKRTVKLTINILKTQFLARDSIYAIARYMPSPVRPSVRPSVRLSVRHTGGSVKDGWS